jgi:hypothetical protein
MSCLRHLEERFPKPDEPMGEAWFMSEQREIYSGLLKSDPQQWPRKEWCDALEAIVSGPTSFGHIEEWSSWFGYLLYASLPLINTWELFSPYELLVSAVMVHCPNEQAAYSAWLPDILATLGRHPFDLSFWENERIRDDAFFAPLCHWPRGWALAPGGSIAAAFHLVAKYLDEALLPEWMAFVMAIKDVLWRAKIVECLRTSTCLFLEEGKGPADLHGWVSGGWNGAGSIRGTLNIGCEDTGIAYLSVSRREAVVDALRSSSRREDIAIWERDFFDVAAAIGEIDEIYDEFVESSRQVVTAYDLRP